MHNCKMNGIEQFYYQTLSKVEVMLKKHTTVGYLELILKTHTHF